ncbi:MAG TPA: helix-turn-helix transcriptional regulator [Actinomycetota bacterium]|nr:helix-turn-helix transcriptional regulator [Actinomycetota bacterium]
MESNRSNDSGGPARSRWFPIDPSSVERIRRFIEEEVASADPTQGEAMAPVVSGAAAEVLSRQPTPVQVVLTVSEERVEVTVSRGEAERDRDGSGPRTGVSFAAWMREMLKQEHVSQEAAARRVGVSLKTMNRWVQGQTEPRLRELRRVEHAFGRVPLG